MPDQLPKLLLLDGPHIPAVDIAQALNDHYEVIVTSLDAAPHTPGLSDCQVILCGTQDFDPLQEALTSSESAAVLDAIGQAVCMCSTQGQILWTNERFRSLDETTRARIVAVAMHGVQHFEERIIEQDPTVFSQTRKFEVASGDDESFYEVLVAPLGRRSDHEGFQARGPLERVAAFVWDVTSTHRVQQKMDAIDRAGDELVRLDAQAIRKMHATERLKLLQEKVVRFSHDLLSFDHLAIRLIDETTGKLELVIHSGLPPEAMELDLYAKRDGNGIMGYVAASGKSYLCPDTTQDRRYLIGLRNARSSLTVPMRINDRVIGAFNVESERLAAFTEEDRQFAEIFARHVALALHILDLLVIERCETGQTVSGTVQGELSEPLDDIAQEVSWLRDSAGNDPALRKHIDRIMSDVDAIRARVRDVAEGPQNILGAERALLDCATDPLLSGKRVLVADDQPKIRQIIRDVLRAKGCAVTVCNDGQEAINLLDASADQSNNTQPFDLVLSDIKMPDRNGYEVFAAARKASETVPVILMTGFGYDPHHSIVRASQEGLQCVLFKPFQIERLLEECRKALAPDNQPATSPAD